MSEWPVVRFHEIAAEEKSAFSKPYGSAITKEDYVSQGVPVVRGVNLRRGIFADDEFVFIGDEKADKMPGANLAPGDLVFTHRGTIGQVSMIPRQPRYDRYVLSTSHVKARLDAERAFPEFYYYWFSSLDGQHELLSNISTVGVPGLGQPVATVKALKVPFPPLPVQKSIARILGALDDKIAANSRISVASDAFCAAVFADLLSGGAPPSIVPLGTVADVNIRSARPVLGGYLRYVDISSVGVGSLDWPPRIAWKDAPSRARRGVQVGDTIWSTVRPNRRSHALILDDDPDLVVSTGFAVLTPKTVGPAFLFETTKSDGFVSYLESVAEGSAYPAVRADRFLHANIAIPEHGQLATFEATAFSVRSRAHAAGLESRTLAALRDALLPQLMSGKLRVRDAERIVEETT